MEYKVSGLKVKHRSLTPRKSFCFSSLIWKERGTGEDKGELLTLKVKFVALHQLGDCSVEETRDEFVFPIFPIFPLWPLFLLCRFHLHQPFTSRSSISFAFVFFYSFFPSFCFSLFFILVSSTFNVYLAFPVMSSLFTPTICVLIVPSHRFLLICNPSIH